MEFECECDWEKRRKEKERKKEEGKKKEKMFFGAVRNQGTENARVGWKMRYALHRNPIPARVGLDLGEGSYQLKTTGMTRRKDPNSRSSQHSN